MAGGIKLVVKNVKDFDQAITKLVDRVDLTNKEIVVEGAAIIAKNAKNQFSTAVVNTKTGATRTLPSGGKRVKGERILKKGNHVSGSKPHNRSGALARSIRMVAVEELGRSAWSSQTAPTLVYSRRIELGFTGTDSLGRMYDQPPFPYLHPGLISSTGELQELYVRKWRGAIK